MLYPTRNTCPYYLRPCYLHQTIHAHIILRHIISHTQYTSKPFKRVIFHSFQNYFYYLYFSKYFIYYLI